MIELCHVVLYIYKIPFGLVNSNWSNMFAFNVIQTTTHGYSYKLSTKTVRIDVCHNFFCNLVINWWNRRPASDSYFKSFNSF